MTFWQDLDFAYTTSANVYGLSQDAGHVELSGLSVRNLAPGTQTSFGARFSSMNYGFDYRFHDLAFFDMDGNSLGFKWATDFEIHDVAFYYSHDLETSNAPYCIIADSSTQNGLINHIRSRYGRHVFTAAGGTGATEFAPGYITLADAQVTEHRSTAFDTHPGSRKIRFVNCWASGGNSIIGSGEPTVGQVSGFQIRGPDCEIINPRVDNMPCDGILLVNGADRARVIGGRINNVGVANYNGPPLETSGIRVTNSDACYIGGDLRIDSPVGDGIKTDVNSGGWTPTTFYTGGSIHIVNAGGFGINNAGGYTIIPLS